VREISAKISAKILFKKIGVLLLNIKSAQRDTNLRAVCTKADQMLKQAEPHSCKVNGNGKVILDTHPESDQHQN